MLLIGDCFFAPTSIDRRPRALRARGASKLCPARGSSSYMAMSLFFSAFRRPPAAETLRSGADSCWAVPAVSCHSLQIFPHRGVATRLYGSKRARRRRVTGSGRGLRNFVEIRGYVLVLLRCFPGHRRLDGSRGERRRTKRGNGVRSRTHAAQKPKKLIPSTVMFLSRARSPCGCLDIPAGPPEVPRARLLRPALYL